MHPRNQKESRSEGGSSALSQRFMPTAMCAALPDRELQGPCRVGSRIFLFVSVLWSYVIDSRELLLVRAPGTLTRV